MSISGLRRDVFSIAAAAALLPGCGSRPPIGAPSVWPQAHSVTPASTVAQRVPSSSAYTVVHYFNSRSGGPGWDPSAGLLDVGDTLYGTTFTGGASGNGSVYSMNTRGAVTVLHAFTGGPADGSQPDAVLTDVNGTLYGTTLNGGSSGNGTIYSQSTSGAETVLYSFNGPGNSDGASPVGPLLDANGILYGTTQYGGKSNCHFGYGCGTVYSISTTGAEKVLHIFGGGSDGEAPTSGLIDVKGTLYGTTYYGGGSGCTNQRGCGTVFAIGKTGHEKVLYSFRGGPGDGAYPQAGLVDVHGTLYGTTTEGGSYTCSRSVHCGTVYSVTTTGKERVLYNFHDGPDGAIPGASLTKFRGTLYGTTSRAGSENWPKGCGTIYSITASGSEQVLHVFTCLDGRQPTADLTQVDGALYGPTSQGGKLFHTGCGPQWVHDGCGLVFALTP